MKLHRDIGVTQKTAWFMLQRIREAFRRDDDDEPPFTVPVEADESYFGGREKNKHESKKLNAGRGTVGKTAVVGAKDRDTNQVAAKVVPGTKAKFDKFSPKDLQRYVNEFSGRHNVRLKDTIAQMVHTADAPFIPRITSRLSSVQRVRLVKFAFSASLFRPFSILHGINRFLMLLPVRNSP